jgi:hypothetical protein
MQTKIADQRSGCTGLIYVKSLTIHDIKRTLSNIARGIPHLAVKNKEYPPFIHRWGGSPPIN